MFFSQNQLDLATRNKCQYLLIQITTRPFLKSKTNFQVMLAVHFYIDLK